LETALLLTPVHEWNVILLQLPYPNALNTFPFRECLTYTLFELFYLQIPAFVFHGIVPCVAITSSAYFHGSKEHCDTSHPVKTQSGILPTGTDHIQATLLNTKVFTVMKCRLCL
jgi:hypothetical protein